MEFNSPSAIEIFDNMNMVYREFVYVKFQELRNKIHELWNGNSAKLNYVSTLLSEYYIIFQAFKNENFYSYRVYNNKFQFVLSRFGTDCVEITNDRRNFLSVTDLLLDIEQEVYEEIVGQHNDDSIILPEEVIKFSKAIKKEDVTVFPDTLDIFKFINSLQSDKKLSDVEEITEFIWVDTQTINVSYNGTFNPDNFDYEQVIVQVISNCEWHLEYGEHDWYSLSVKNNKSDDDDSKGGGLNSSYFNDVYVNVNRNDSVPRSDKFYIVTKNQRIEVAINQNSDGKEFIFDSSNIVNVNSDGAKIYREIITLDTCVWKILQSEGSENWLTINPRNGKGSYEIEHNAESKGVEFVVNQNTGNARSATITVTYKLTPESEEQTLQFTVNQQKFESAGLIALTKESSTFGYNAGSNGEEDSFGISATLGVRWQIENIPSWISVSPTAGASTGGVGVGGGTSTPTSKIVTIEVTDNSSVARMGNFTIRWYYGDATGTLLYTVKQNASPTVGTTYFFSISPLSLTFAKAGSTKQFSITTDNDVEWSIQSGATWVVVDTMSGTGSKSNINVTVSKNVLGNIRSTSLTIIYKKGSTEEKTKTMVITQSGLDSGEFVPVEDKFEIVDENGRTPDPGGDVLIPET